MAIKQRKPGRGLLLHSDLGSQYASYCNQVLLKRNGILCSMSRKGTCWDNVVMESFYRTLKVELSYPQKHETRIGVKRAKLNISKYFTIEKEYILFSGIIVLRNMKDEENLVFYGDTFYELLNVLFKKYKSNLKDYFLDAEGINLSSNIIVFIKKTN